MEGALKSKSWRKQTSFKIKLILKCRPTRPISPSPSAHPRTGFASNDHWPVCALPSVRSLCSVSSASEFEKIVLSLRARYITYICWTFQSERNHHLIFLCNLLEKDKDLTKSFDNISCQDIFGTFYQHIWKQDFVYIFSLSRHADCSVCHVTGTTRQHQIKVEIVCRVCNFHRFHSFLQCLSCTAPGWFLN